MSQNIQEVFKRVQGRKKEQRELKRIYKDALSVNSDYQEVLDQLEALKLKKKKIEAAIQADFKEEFDKLEGLKLNITSDNQLLSDVGRKQNLSILLTKPRSLTAIAHRTCLRGLNNYSQIPDYISPEVVHSKSEELWKITDFRSERSVAFTNSSKKPVGKMFITSLRKQEEGKILVRIGYR